MPNLKLHIISFDVPLPANYGGVIDVFFKLKNLSEQGVEIYLHCFEYGRAHATELEKLCKKVWYYPRKTGWAGLSLLHPYMQYSRRDKHLLSNLLSINAPILFEGVHSCYLLNHPDLQHRKKIVRNHNIEQEYFALLMKQESNFFKKTYYRIESLLLKKAENRLNAANYLVPISETDAQFFQALYPEKRIEYISGFHPYNEIVSNVGRGDFCLYHGNLAHPENIEAASYLLQHVFNDMDVRLVVAGRNPHPQIIALCNKNPNVSLIPNPDDTTMSNLIATAQIHVLPTFQASGLKLKLLYSLFAGRFVLVNQTMLNGTNLKDVCIIADDTATDFKQKIRLWMKAEFNEHEIVNRKNTLQKNYNNVTNASKIINIMQD